MTTPPRRSSGVAAKGIDVILVEDDEDTRIMMTTRLTAQECIVRAFAEAEPARLAALTRVPDVVVTDLRLGDGVPGSALAHALRDDARTQHVSLIAVTGAVEPGRDVMATFDAYLRKPIDMALLIELVRQLARISRAEWQRARESGS